MSAYRVAFQEAVMAIGLKKALAELLSVAKVIDDTTAGQVIAHINNGGITKIVKSVEIK
jgi:hypothetical protein